jgi:hypothetical protein
MEIPSHGWIDGVTRSYGGSACFKLWAVQGKANVCKGELTLASISWLALLGHPAGCREPIGNL